MIGVRLFAWHNPGEWGQFVGTLSDQIPVHLRDGRLVTGQVTAAS